jgi:replicative DNA helicase Mcm
VRELERDSWPLGNTGIQIPVLKELTEFLETYCSDELVALATEYPEKASLYIKYEDIYKFSRGLTHAFEKYFYKIEPIIKLALAGDGGKSTNAAGPFRYRDDVEEITDNLNIRITDVHPALKQPIRDLSKKDIGKLVYIDGFARLASGTKPKVTKVAFKCLRCGHVTYVEQNGLKFEEPFAGCENDTCGKKGPFDIDYNLSEWVDFQRIQVQELPDSTAGAKPQDIIVECEDDLTQLIKSGDRVSVVGILVVRQESNRDGKKSTFEKVIKALSIEKKDLGFDEYILTQSDEAEILELSNDPDIKNKIIMSLAPSIHGNEDIKEALILQQFGGVKKSLPDETIQRGEIHIQLIGDPGGAKTRFLKRAVQISPRGIYASGRSASAAGLTAAAVKDPLNDGAWVLEGGAAVMASGGILALDEAGQVRDEDKSALHEVMESGTISVAKAGIVATLKAECALIMAGNPISGYFDRNSNFAEQMGIPPALWSRVTLTYIVLDDPNVKKDTAISDHILKNHRIGGMIQNKMHSKDPVYSEREIQECIKEIEAPIPEEMLRKYIAYARLYIYPVASESISKEITDFYVDIRKMKVADPTSPVPITARTVEDVQRLAEAHARMRLSNLISHDDVEAAKRIMIGSLRQVGMDDNGRLDANILYGGNSKSQEDRIKTLMSCIRELHNGHEVICVMKDQHGIPEDTTRYDIKKLAQRGKIYEEQRGEWKTVQ